MTHSRSGRRIAALVSGVGLAAASLLAAPVAPAAAAPPNDSDAAVAGGDWLVSQLTDGSIYNEQFDFIDWGLTLDTGFALDEYGSGYDADLAAVTAAAASPEAVASYTTFDDFDIPGVRLAGESGKLLSFAVSQGVDPGDVGGVDLLAELESLVATEAPITGRVENRTTPESGPDNANVIGQIFAVRALEVTDSPRAGDARRFLLTQQCDAGFFRVFLNASASERDQSCEGGRSAGESAASPDATALAVINLLATEPAEGSRIGSAVDEALAWLVRTQADDGSFTGGPGPTNTANTNSTGLAASAFAAAGRNTPATAAASWVAGRQVAGLAECEGELTTDEDGAVAYDDDAIARGRDEGVPLETRDQWRRASGQAVPALRSLPAPGDNPALSQEAEGRYVPAGRTAELPVTGLAVGQKVCVTGPGGTASVRAPGAPPTVSVSVPRGSAERTYGLGVSSVTVRPLTAKRFDVRLAKAAVARGARQTVTVRDLASRERVTVRLRGAVVDTGFATDGGFFRRSFVVTGRPGAAPVKVTGQFAASRFGTDGFTVR